MIVKIQDSHVYVTQPDMTLKKVIFSLKQYGFELRRVIPVGFPENSFAPIFVIEAGRK